MRSSAGSRVERQLKAKELTQLNAELEETTRQLAETADQVERLERTVVIQRPDVEARLVELYKAGWTEMKLPRFRGHRAPMWGKEVPRCHVHEDPIHQSSGVG